MLQSSLLFEISALFCTAAFEQSSFFHHKVKTTEAVKREEQRARERERAGNCIYAFEQGKNIGVQTFAEKDNE